MFSKFKEKWENQSPVTKGFLLIILIVTIGIILRWDYIIKEISNGFKYFSK